MDNKKIVKIDVDGVLRDLVGSICHQYNTLFPWQHTDAADVTEYDIDASGQFGLIDSTYDLKPTRFFFHESAVINFYHADAFEGVKEAVQSLRDGGYHVAIVTWQLSDDNKRYTLDWLAEHIGAYDSIHFTRDKWLVKGDYLIDDNPEFLFNPNETAEKMMVVRPYTRDSLNEYQERFSFHTVESVKEAADFILNSGGRKCAKTCMSCRSEG